MEEGSRSNNPAAQTSSGRAMGPTQRQIGSDRVQITVSRPAVQPVVPASEVETVAETEERKAEDEQRRKQYEAEQERKAEERRQEFERQQKVYEVEQERKMAVQKARTGIYDRLIAKAPATFTAPQWRVLLRALVNLDPYTLADHLAAELAEDDDTDQRSTEEVLTDTIDALSMLN